jgi:hypothetical protein
MDEFEERGLRGGRYRATVCDRLSVFDVYTVLAIISLCKRRFDHLLTELLL